MNFYIHIPFCRQKCPYCKFALTPIFDEAKKRRYIAYLKSEIEKFFSEHNPPSPLSTPWWPLSSFHSDSPVQGGIKTIYFGGGTPSILSLDEVREILDCFDTPSPSWEGWGEGEISFECNPEDITREYVTWLLELWVNRISLGIQSLNDETLKAIHRSDRRSILNALSAINTLIHDRKISLNIDFILGLPYSKPWETLKNIQEIHEKFPYITHTSVYMLEDGLYPKEWRAHSFKEGEIEREYSAICEYFESLDWNHYEISNWSRPWYECRHNTWYWNHTNYRGFGLSATNYHEWKRWENSHSFQWYSRGEISSVEILDSKQIALEKTIFATRTFTLSSPWFDENILANLMKEWLIEIINNKIHLTPSWIFQENTIISKLIEN